jgi:hypothetical protein
MRFVVMLNASGRSKSQTASLTWNSPGRPRGSRVRLCGTRFRELDRQFDLDFPDFIRTKFPSELVMILGIPEAGPDTPDHKPPRR